MSDIRLTVCLPDNNRLTIRVDKDDIIADWVRTVLKENAFGGILEDYSSSRNKNQNISFQSSFANQGFVNGDELHITKHISPSRPSAPAVHEIEDIPPVTEGRTFHQLGILVLDGSESMGEPGNGGITLSEWVNRAVREFLGFFKNSSQINNFSIAVITFDNEAKLHTPVTLLSDIDDFADYNPLNNHGGGTYIGAGLMEAEKLATEFLALSKTSDIPHDVKIIIMSDGLCLDPVNTKIIADRIKKNQHITICSSLFTQLSQSGGEIAEMAKTILADIASTPTLYKTTYKEKDLRQFFISSMSAKRKYGDDTK